MGSDLSKHFKVKSHHKSHKLKKKFNSNGNLNGVQPQEPRSTDNSNGLLTNGGISGSARYLSNGTGQHETSPPSRSKSSTNLHRSQSLRRDNSWKLKSTFSLRRIGSYRNWQNNSKHGHHGSSRNNTASSVDVWTNKRDSGDFIPFSTNSDTCCYINLYKKLNQKSFGTFRCMEEKHPIFIKYHVEKKKTMLLSTCSCCDADSLCVLGPISNLLLKEIVISYQSNTKIKQFENLEFHLNGHNKTCEIISMQVFEKFCETLGPELKEVKMLTKYSDFKHLANIFEDDISAFTLHMMHVCSNNFPNLVNVELILSQQLTVDYFKLFHKSFKSQLKSLTVQFIMNSDNFVDTVYDTLKRVSDMRQLNSLKIGLFPTFKDTKTVALLDLGKIMESIELLAHSLTDIKDVSLSFDALSFNCLNLNPLDKLSEFSSTESLSLTILGDIKQIGDCGLKLDFSCMKSNKELKNFQIDCSSLSNDDIAQMCTNCAQLQQLHIGCDVRVTSEAAHLIAKYLSQLERLYIGYATSSSTSKEPLFIDNTALNVLLDNKPDSLPKLRSIELVRCRIDIENNATISNLISWASFNIDYQVSLWLEDNRFPLIRQAKFKEKYDYLPENLQLKWSYGEVSYETDL